MGRLAVVPMVLEARGLERHARHDRYLRARGETAATDALRTIYAEEVGHVAYGVKWFNWLCGRDGLDPKEVFHALVRRYFHGALNRPFNEESAPRPAFPPISTGLSPTRSPRRPALPDFGDHQEIERKIRSTVGEIPPIGATSGRA